MSAYASSGQEQATKFLDAPSSWNHARGQIFICCAKPSSGKLVPASYHDLEKDTYFSQQEFTGGLQVCVIVRYTESPIGAYDEVLWIPGTFKLPGPDHETYRATRAYVSTVDSVYNGRKNWNVPKKCAKFEFTPSEEGSHLPYSRITISPCDQQEPFIQLNLEPTLSKFLPFLPIDTKFVPIGLNFDFPPLPESQCGKDDGLIGTSNWQRVHLRLSGRAGIVKATGSVVGDGNFYPELGNKKYWLWLRDATIQIQGKPIYLGKQVS
ncbi:uncharacterized protein KD926_003766 [Aspergillus affinis]|uniref:uncharacterized protein n=1 Tax=Aspergillus affinis TaxID=1070780 RepID=UPI0022FE44DB|nr:uncharacterized protein KD926_003766 [Aspergillus affinis]KAI9035294.1 hypothetical protein KD926_003766 [Aspergillus affinis]